MNAYEVKVRSIREKARIAARLGKPMGPFPYKRADFISSYAHAYEYEAKRIAEHVQTEGK